MKKNGQIQKDDRVKKQNQEQEENQRTNMKSTTENTNSRTGVKDFSLKILKISDNLQLVQC